MQIPWSDKTDVANENRREEVSWKVIERLDKRGGKSSVSSAATG